MKTLYCASLARTHAPVRDVMQTRITLNIECRVKPNCIFCSVIVYSVAWDLVVPTCVSCVLFLSPGVYQHVSGSAVGRHAIKILAGERRMVFPTGSVSTPGTLTGVIMVSRDMYFTTFKLHKIITFIINRSSSTLRQWDIRITAV